MSEIAIPTTGEIEALASAELRGTSPAGLPYPESTGPLNQGANDIKALALAVDVHEAGPWVPLAPAAGYTGNIYVRLEGPNAAIIGYLSGTVASGTLCTLPVGYRPVFPPSSGLTYNTAICAAVTSGNSAYATVRVWNTGAVSITALQGAMANIDLGTIRHSVRNG